MGKTIEQKVAEAILQKDIASIEIDGETYTVASPSIATLILVSEVVSTLPVVSGIKGGDATAIVNSVLHHAKDFAAIGDIAAILLLGAKNLTQEVTHTEIRSRFFGLIKSRRQYTEKVDKKAELARLILENVRPSVLWEVIIKRLNMHEIGDFFVITTSLSEANLIKPTKEVES